MGDALLYLLSNCFSSLVISIFLTYIVYQKPDVLFWESYIEPRANNQPNGILRGNMGGRGKLWIHVRARAK